MIRRLPKDVVDRIAAGEVVERPAAVVKELVENALDARATTIDVTIENAGLGLIRVADNGCGISESDMPTAFASHATSKLVDVDDLFHVVSFGFRGEALSSIAAVSRARIISSTDGDGGGYRLDCVAGEVGSLEPVPSAQGTIVEVRDLFHNTPARRQFLGAARTEAARCREVCTALSLVNPGVRLSYTIDGARRFSSEGSSDARERVSAVYGRDFADGMTSVASQEPGVHIEGLLGLPAFARPRARAQLLFVNGRLVKDRGVLAAVRVACRDFVPPNLHVSWVLFLTIDPERLDVNVHPTKAEVRFQDRDTIFRLVRRASREALLRSDLAPRIRAGHVSPQRTAPSAPESSPSTMDRREWRARRPEATSTSSPEDRPVSPEPPPAAPTLTGVGRVKAAARFLQVLDTYLIHDSPEGLVLVDQHALHERILYARLQDDLAAGRIERQGLLVPHPVRLTPELHALALEKSEELQRLGLEIEDFGSDTVVVRSVPAVLRQESVDDLVEALVAPPDVHGGVPHGLDRRLFTMACHAAVKAGDKLKEEEIAELIEQGEQLEHDSTCPHGRPTRLLIGSTELERLFKRSGF
ncbi:MAG: DNA mismatch repair endonuclease MutL [Planctomycetota bacterium]|nr:DNA mismatch repair endonuclease MutL [Planctomycetota bacterium]